MSEKTESAYWEKERNKLAEMFPVHLRDEAKKSWIIQGKVGGIKVLKIKPEMLCHLNAVEEKGESCFHEKIVHQGTYVLPEQKHPVFAFEDDF